MAGRLSITIPNVRRKSNFSSLARRTLGKHVPTSANKEGWWHDSVMVVV